MEKEYILAATVYNHFGVLQRVSGLFSRRGYNIKSLIAAETQDPAISNMTIVAVADENTVLQIKNQLLKLVDVYSVQILNEQNSVSREHILIMVQATKSDLSGLIEKFGALSLMKNPGSTVLELNGDPQLINEFIKEISQYKIIKLVRSGVNALHTAE